MPLPAVPDFDADRPVRSLTRVSWAAQVQLPRGGQVPVRVREISEHEAVLVGDVPLPAQAVLQVALRMPSIDRPGRFTPISACATTRYTTIDGGDIRSVVGWVEIPEDDRQALRRWLGAR